MEGKTIFINISSDSVLTDTGDDYRIVIPRDHVERLLGGELIKLYREKGFENVIVLNGPGGFTNLRVGTLCLNILNILLENKLSFYGISKIDLYEIAHKEGILPRYGVIYIGQKRNIRLRDFEKNEKIGQYSFNELESLEEMEKSENVFIEDVEEKDYYPEWIDKYIKYHIVFIENAILLIDGRDFNKSPISINKLDLKPLKSIAPNYMMEPSVTIK